MPASRTHMETLLAHCVELQASKEACDARRSKVQDRRDMFGSDAPTADSIASARADAQRERAGALNVADMTRGDGILLVTHLIDVFGVEDVVRWVRNVAATKGVALPRLDGGR